MGAANAGWRKVSGEELIAEGPAALVPEVSAIYLWKLRLRSHTTPGDLPGLMREAEELTKALQGSVAGVRASHSLRIGRVDIRGQGLGNKAAGLREFLGAPANRRWFLLYLEHLEAQLPAIYCGETGNLKDRVRQHISGQSDFGRFVQSSGEYDWRRLNLFWYVAGPPVEGEAFSAKRRAIEHFTTILTISPLTKRPG